MTSQAEEQCAAIMNIRRRNSMEKILHLHIEKLPEGVYLATSESVQGLIAQGRTVAETLEIARDVARKLMDVPGQGAAA
jgi:hypothetical protein